MPMEVERSAREKAAEHYCCQRTEDQSHCQQATSYRRCGQRMEDSNQCQMTCICGGRKKKTKDHHSGQMRVYTAGGIAVN